VLVPQDRQRPQRAAQVRPARTAKAALAEIWNAEDTEHAEAAAKVFAADYGTKWPKAAAKIADNLDVLLEFYDYSAEHWIHLRTTNPIESTFATVRLRQRVTKGPGSRAGRIAMAFKLIESAQSRWRAVNAPHLVAPSAPARSSRRAKLANETTSRPTTPATNQQVISKSRDTPIHRSLRIPP
jgi:hypothetical protein